MAPYWKYNYRRRWRNRRRPFRRRRPRKNIFRRTYRKRRTVRRKTRKRYFKKKLKKIKLQQWQPRHIKKCKIRGIFSLFAAGYGRYSYDYEIYRESLVPEKEPGGGGWSTFKISLGNLYSENERLLNWWTKSNKYLNLCRYYGVQLRFYRMPEVDYVATYSNTYPFQITKFQFASTHPQRLLLYNQKIVVPSFRTAPHIRKRYIKKFVFPPSEFYNKWFFQSDLAPFSLIMITTAACSLTEYFISNQAENNNVRLYSLNTNIFIYKNFKEQNETTFGYHPKVNYYLYGSLQETVTKASQLAYLGNVLQNKPGEPTGKEIGKTGNTYINWGNPFYYHYLNDTLFLWVSKDQPNTILTTDQQTTLTPGKITRMSNPIIQQCAYNPFKDKGYGNKAYWVKITQQEQGWDTEPSSDLIIEGFPLWIMLWGWIDWTEKLQKIHHIDDDYALVVKTKYISPTLPHYIFLSDSYVHGQPPYHGNIEEMPLYHYQNWYPSWKYQKEAIEEILMSGPGVCKLKKNIHAHLGYTFYFKWGGNPSTMENVYDPATQPSYPLPNKIGQGLEIENPQQDPTKFLYNFDVRRDFITQTAAKRLKQKSTTELSMFTDGVPDQQNFSPPIQTQQTQTLETSDSEEEETQTLQQFQQCLQQRLQLQQRYRHLKTLLQSSKLHTQE